MTVGYDRDRVRRLGRLALAAIDECARIRSDDPAAAEALRAVRLTRRNLEDLWMPAVRDIERSEAMVSWSSSRLTTTPTTATGFHEAWWSRTAPSTPLATLTDTELVDEVTWTDAFLTSNQAPAPGDLAMLAAELGRRAARDPAFADRLVRLASRAPIVGRLAEYGTYAPELSGRLLVASLRPIETVVVGSTPRYRATIEALMAELLPTPGAILDILMTPGVLADLTERRLLDADVDLDPDLVSAFVVGGLHGAVAEDANRLPDSYGVLAELIRLTNGPLDGGLPPAIALGIATSMVGYVDTLAPAVRQEGPTPVLVLDAPTGLDVDIGTYDDLVDLFGALLRDPEAQAALGTVLGGYTAAVVTGLGADVVELPGVEHVARFADLIADASRTEQVELVLEAAAEEARLRQISDAIGFAVDGALTLTDVGSVTQIIIARAIALVTGRSAHVEPAQLPDARLSSGTYDLIMVAAVSVIVGDPAARRAAGLESIGRADQAELTRQVDEFSAESDPDERARRARRLDHWIEVHQPMLAGWLGRLRSAPGMDELTETRTAANPD